MSANQNQGQNSGLLSNVGNGNLRKKAKEKLNNLRNNSQNANMGQSGGVLQNVQLPNNPGPALAGRTPVVGTLRRANDMPVLRDKLKNKSSGS